MSTPTAMLNKMASTPASRHSTRKRQRKSASDDAPPSKRRAVASGVTGQGTDVTAAESALPIPRKSKTRLSRPSLPLSVTPKPALRRGDNKYDFLESPEKAKEKEKEAKPEKPKAKPKKMRRKVGLKKVQTASPFKGMGIGKLGELESGAILTSFASPVKKAIPRRNNPLLGISLQNLQQQGDADAEPQLSECQERPAGEASEHNASYAPSKAMPRTSANGDPASEELEKEVQGQENRGIGSSASQIDEIEEDEPGQQLLQETRQIEQHYWSPNERHDIKRRRASEPRSDASAHEAVEAAAPRQRSSSAAVHQREKRPSWPVELEQGPQETEEGESEQDQAAQEERNAEPARRRGGRPAMSQEERQARTETEARKRAENALETEAAELADFERRGQNFVRGIEDLAESIGGVGAWSKVGGGAKTITAMVARRTEMETERCQSVWRQIRKLAKWFKGLEEGEVSEVVETLGKLQARATWKHLSRDGDTRRGDQAIIEIYEHLVPHSVYLVRSALKGRFYPVHKHSWQELLMLVNVAMSLCSAASEWRPKPSALETGIRREVRNHIRPGLDAIREALQAQVDQLEQKERNQRKAKELERAQKRARSDRERKWADLQSSLISCRSSSLRTSQPTRTRYEQEIVDIDELENEAPAHGTDVKATQLHPRVARQATEEIPCDTCVKAPQTRPRTARQATEEIPAPDPVVVWSQEENVALLNGLQQFRGADRYSRILETYIQLNMKDIDQCMARAQYYKQAYRQVLAEEAAKGTRSHDWLSSV